MNKKILTSIATAAIVAVAGWNVSQASSERSLSDMELANIEALGSEVGERCGGCATNCSGNYCCTLILTGLGTYTLNRCD